MWASNLGTWKHPEKILPHTSLQHPSNSRLVMETVELAGAAKQIVPFFNLGGPWSVFGMSRKMSPEIQIFCSLIFLHLFYLGIKNHPVFLAGQPLGVRALSSVKVKEICRPPPLFGLKVYSVFPNHLSRCSFSLTSNRTWSWSYVFQEFSALQIVHRFWTSSCHSPPLFHLSTSSSTENGPLSGPGQSLNRRFPTWQQPKRRGDTCWTANNELTIVGM